MCACARDIKPINVGLHRSDTLHVVVIHLLHTVLDYGRGERRVCRTVITGQCVVITHIVPGFASRCGLLHVTQLSSSNVKLLAHVSTCGCIECTKSHAPYGFIRIGALSGLRQLSEMFC